MFSLMFGSSEFAMESKEIQTEHIHSRYYGSNGENCKNQWRMKSKHPAKISSFEKKPAKGGAPAIANVPIRKVK